VVNPSLAAGEQNGEVTVKLVLGVHIDEDQTSEPLVKLAKKYINCIVQNMESRFSDEVSRLCDMQTVLDKKPENPDFSQVARLLHVDASEMKAEWKILRRLPDNLSSQSAMINLATSADKLTMFPTMALMTRRLLLLPVGTATVERSFSTMNRILCDNRSRLLADHARQLMLLSIEGPVIPDIRDASDNEKQIMDRLIDNAYKCWIKKPRRGF
jgi:hypothetical protein